MASCGRQFHFCASNSHGFEQKLNIGTGGGLYDFFAGQSAPPKRVRFLKKKILRENSPFSGSAAFYGKKETA